MASKINIEQYVGEIKKRMNLNIEDDIIEKDLLLTLIKEKIKPKLIEICNKFLGK